MRRFRAWALILIVLAAGLRFHRPLRAAALTIFRLPLSLTESAVSVVWSLPHLPHLLDENAALRNDLASRQVELIQLREAVRRLTQAHRLEAAFAQSGGRPARILARTILPVQQIIVLDAGERDGIAVDSVLVVVEGLVGRVIEVYPTKSLAQLVTDPDSRIAGLVERSRESGLVVGTGTNRCRLEYLDVDADVEAGDRIVTAGVGGPILPGLLIGTVVRVTRDERAAETIAVIRPAASIHQIEHVLCLPPSS